MNAEIETAAAHHAAAERAWLAALDRENEAFRALIAAREATTAASAKWQKAKERLLDAASARPELFAPHRQGTSLTDVSPPAVPLDTRSAA